MSSVVRNIAGFPRSLAGRVGMITLLAVVLISTAALQVALPCKPALERADLSDYGDAGKILVVMVFAGNQLQKTITALERWETVRPCSSDTTKSQAHLMLYTDGELGESEDTLKATISGLASIKKCFKEVAYASAALKGVDNTYNKKRENHLWVRGPNQLFYTMMLKIVPGEEWANSGVSHLFWMEPDNIPQHNDWLEHLIARGRSGPYWIQGSSYRGDCIPQEGGGCALIGRAIRAHINGNALYHIGDPAFLDFVEQVSEGEWKHWPFDLAMLKEVHESWPEPRFRQNAHLLQLVDWIRNYGPYPYKAEELPRHVFFIHADPKPAISQEFKGTFTESETDLADKAAAQAAQEAVQLRGELERVRAELEKARGAGEEQKPTGDAVAARLGNEETRRMLLPMPLTIKSPAQEEESSPSLAAAATPEGNVLLAVVTAANAPLLDNYVRLVEKTGAARHLVLVHVDAAAGRATTTLASRVGAVAPFSGKPTLGARVQALLSVLRQGFGVVAADVDDVAWLRDPFLGFSKELELRVAVDARQGTRETRAGREWDPFVSAGVSYSAPTAAVVEFWTNLLKELDSDPTADEDVLVSQLLKQAGTSLRWGTLEPALFPNGPLFFEEHVPQASPEAQSIAVHNTWVSPASARYRFREAGLWPAATPAPGAKYLTYFDAIDENGLNNQRQAFRNALAIARVLNRTLIMPRFHRRHRHESSVPMDYFFDVGRFEAEFPDVQPHRFLEEAFPDWESLPVQVMDVAIPPVPSNAPWLARAVIVKSEREWHGASPAELRGWYAAKEDPLLVFHGLFRRFDKFDDPDEHARFNAQIHRAVVPSNRTLEIAADVTRAVAEASPAKSFDCFHLRHSQEFLDSQRDWGIVTPLPEIVQILVKKIPPSERTLYLTTDVPTQATRDAFLAAGYPSVAFLYDHFPKRELAHVRTLDGEVTMREGQIDQLVCSGAQTFVGNEYSTFTWHIAFLRQQAGSAQVSEDIYDRSRQGMEFL